MMMTKQLCLWLPLMAMNHLKSLRLEHPRLGILLLRILGSIPAKILGVILSDQTFDAMDARLLLTRLGRIAPVRDSFQEVNLRLR